MEVYLKKPTHRELLRQRFLLNQKRITFTFSLSILFVASLLFLYLFQTMEMVDLSNQKEKLLRKTADLEKSRDNLRQEEVNLSSLQRIEFLAKEQFHMIVPAREHRVFLKKPDARP